MTKYDQFKRDRETLLNPKARACTQPDCTGIMYGSALKRHLQCPACQHEQCFKCKEDWHKGTCRAARRKREARLKAKGLLSGGGMALYRWTHNIKKCPKCKVPVQRIEGCNHMTCAVCEHQFCWMCRGKYTDNHYAPWNLWGCPLGQEGCLAFLGDDRVCGLDLGFGIGLMGKVKRTVIKTVGVGLVLGLGVPGLVLYGTARLVILPFQVPRLLRERRLAALASKRRAELRAEQSRRRALGIPLANKSSARPQTVGGLV